MVVLLGHLGGCVILPIPVARTAGEDKAHRSNIGGEVPATLVQGSTTRRQVLLALGEPDGRGADDRWFTYEAVSRRPGLHWAFIAAAEGGGGGIGSIDSWDTARRLTIRFDERGIVSSAALDRKNCTSSFLDSANCPSASGEDLAKADEARRGEQLMASSGSVLGRYQSFEMRRGSGPACVYSYKLPQTLGDQFIVMQHNVMWRDNRQRWGSVAVDEIEDVKPVEQHQLQRWIPVATRDGSCFFVHLQTALQSSNNEAQRQIVSAVTAARAAQH